MGAEHFDLPYALEQLLLEVCGEQSGPERQHDESRMLLARPSANWPACCGSDCRPCVDDQKAIAKQILGRWAPRPLDFQR